MFLYISALLVILVYVFHLYIKNVYTYWEKKEVPTSPFKYFVGNLGPSLTLSKGLAQCYEEIYTKFQGYRYVGYYKFMQPGIILRDPELIKDVLVKNFTNFHDNDIHVEKEIDLIFGKNPFTLNGNEWKVVRNQVTPIFSSSKVRATIPLLEENRQKFIKYLQNEPNATNTEGLETKDLSSKFTCENVASVAFGLNGNSFVDAKADFREIGRKLTEPSFIQGMKQLAVFVFPTLSKVFKIKFFSDEITQFLRNIVQTTTKYRKDNNIKRNDFLEYFNELKTKLSPEFNEDDVLAHAGGFFGDGFETSSIAICFALYELAANQHVQNKLRNEVDAVLKKHNGEMTYEAIQEMIYLDCVLKESLRIHVPLLAMSKLCTESFKLPPILEDNQGPEVIIEAGTPIIIPVNALHHDPKYFPDPESFKPERFSEENKEKINKFAYLPFGEGPRICLGMRFGLLQSKVAIATAVSEFVLKVNSKTIVPIKVDPRFFMKSAEGGLWINYFKRDK